MSTSLPSAMKAALENIEPDAEALSYDTYAGDAREMHGSYAGDIGEPPPAEAFSCDTCTAPCP